MMMMMMMMTMMTSTTILLRTYDLETTGVSDRLPDARACRIARELISTYRVHMIHDQSRRGVLIITGKSPEVTVIAFEYL